MTGEQYVRANKRVYNVVIILLAVMTILSVMACLAEFKITILLQTAAAVAGIIVVNTYAKKFWNSKKGGEILLGTGSAVYCVFLLLNQNNFVYAYGIPLFVACVLYLDVKFVYYGIGVTAVGNIIHIIVQVITKRADGIELFFSIIILATVVYAVYEASILLTKFSEENLEMQAAASEKMLATAENLVKHFDSAKEKLETLEEVINNNNESISNIAHITEKCCLFILCTHLGNPEIIRQKLHRHLHILSIIDMMICINVMFHDQKVLFLFHFFRKGDLSRCIIHIQLLVQHIRFLLLFRNSGRMSSL